MLKCQLLSIYISIFPLQSTREELNHENLKKIDELRVPAETSIAEIDSNSSQDVRHVLMSFLHCYFAIITH